MASHPRRQLYSQSLPIEPHLTEFSIIAWPTKKFQHVSPLLYGYRYRPSSIFHIWEIRCHTQKPNNVGKLTKWLILIHFWWVSKIMKQYFLNPGKTDTSRVGVKGKQNAQQTIWKLKSKENQYQYYYETCVRFQEDRKFKYEETDGEKSNISYDIRVNIAHRTGVSINVSLTYLTFRKTVDLCLVSLQFQQHYTHNVNFSICFLTLQCNVQDGTNF